MWCEHVIQSMEEEESLATSLTASRVNMPQHLRDADTAVAVADNGDDRDTGAIVQIHSFIHSFTRSVSIGPVVAVAATAAAEPGEERLLAVAARVCIQAMRTSATTHVVRSVETCARVLVCLCSLDNR